MSHQGQNQKKNKYEGDRQRFLQQLRELEEQNVYTQSSHAATPVHYQQTAASENKNKNVKSAATISQSFSPVATQVHAPVPTFAPAFASALVPPTTSNTTHISTPNAGTSTSNFNSNSNSTPSFMAALSGSAAHKKQNKDSTVHGVDSESEDFLQFIAHLKELGVDHQHPFETGKQQTVSTPVASTHVPVHTPNHSSTHVSTPVSSSGNKTNNTSVTPFVDGNDFLSSLLKNANLGFNNGGLSEHGIVNQEIADFITQSDIGQRVLEKSINHTIALNEKVIARTAYTNGVLLKLKELINDREFSLVEFLILYILLGKLEAHAQEQAKEDVLVALSVTLLEKILERSDDKCDQ